jgi:hypothetical protein
MKINNTHKSRKNQRKVNIVKSKSKKGSPHSYIKHKASSISRGINNTSKNNLNIIKKTNLGTLCYNIDGKIKSNFYQKIQNFRLKNTRSNSINVNNNNNIKQKKYSCDINSNYSLLMNVRQGNKLL